jgi:hypothetical protein
LSECHKINEREINDEKRDFLFENVRGFGNALKKK